jgi:hypothetical protein
MTGKEREEKERKGKGREGKEGKERERNGKSPQCMSMKLVSRCCYGQFLLWIYFKDNIYVLVTLLSAAFVNFSRERHFPS